LTTTNAPSIGKATGKTAPMAPSEDVAIEDIPSVKAVVTTVIISPFWHINYCLNMLIIPLITKPKILGIVFNKNPTPYPAANKPKT